MRFERPTLIPLLFFIAGFGLCVGLGVWQIKRLQWKEGLIADIEAAKALAPTQIGTGHKKNYIDSYSVLPNALENLPKFNFHPYCITGNWYGTPVPKGQLRPLEFHLVGRYFRGRLGYSIISPLIFHGDAHGDRIILVNRGWVPAAKKDISTRPEMVVADKETQVCGLLRVGNERSYFTPKNKVESNLWFARDVYEMAAFGKLPYLVPAMLDATGTQDAKHLPVPSDGTIRVRNDHLGYVLTWFGIALGILVIFVTYHRKK